MWSKNDPTPNGCHAAALPDEPTFTLLARDPDFYRLVHDWAMNRWRMVLCGERPESDRARVDEAWEGASFGAKWRRENNGIWRRQ